MENNNEKRGFGLKGAILGLTAAAGYAAFTYVKKKAKAKKEVIDIPVEETPEERTEE